MGLLCVPRDLTAHEVSDLSFVLSEADWIGLPYDARDVKIPSAPLVTDTLSELISIARGPPQPVPLSLFSASETCISLTEVVKVF